MMALVKPLIVCIWVELELVIGKRTHCLLQSLSLFRKLVYPRASQVSFFFFFCGGCISWNVTSGDGREYSWLTL